MSMEIGLQRIDAAGAAGPRHTGVLNELMQTAKRVLADAGLLDDTTMADDGQSFTVIVPGGTARIFGSCAVFPLVSLDTLWLRMVYAVAKAGDMIVVEDGLAILTDPAQPRPAWVSASKLVPVCSSPDELGTLLEPWYKRQRHYADEMRRELNPKTLVGPSEPIPGSREDSKSAAIYVQLRGSETVLDLLDSSGRFYRAATRDHAPNVPKSGGDRGTSWLLRTPAGEEFVALIVDGDKEGWLKLIKDFASSQSRLFGRIVNGDMFLTNDGRSFAIDACTCERPQQ